MLFEGDRRFTVGLTGMSGAGKSTACTVFAEHGFTVVNCDMVAREVVMPGEPALEKIKETFGSDVICGDGTLDRKKLGGIVFSDAEKLNALDEIIYPYITYNIMHRLVASDEDSMILLDAPTLFESGVDMLCDCIVSITADIGICRERIMKRDSLTEEEAAKRLSSQFGAEFYETRSDHTVKNNENSGIFIERIEKVIAEITDNERK